MKTQIERSQKMNMSERYIEKIRHNVRKAIEKTVEWTKKTDAGRPAMEVCSEEIDEFFADLHAHSEVQE
jgi:uncharacterized NAD(P)/FAD-binding protein YdhS